MKMKPSLILSLCLFVLFTSTLSVQADTVDSYLASNKLKDTTNGVFIDYLIEEGQKKLTEAQQKKALDQAVFQLKQKINVTKDEQLDAALTSLVGMSMQMAGDDVVAGAGQDVEQSSYGGQWKSWVDAAFSLLKAGYTEDAIAFFEYGMKTIPYSGLRARCMLGLAQAKPNETYDRLIKMTENPDSDLKKEALKLLGHLAGDGKITQKQKDTIIELLIAHTEGVMNNIYYRAAVLGLDAAKDKRAIPAISTFKEGMMVNDDVKRPALKSLLLTYKDDSVVPLLTGMFETGFMSTADEYDRYFAGTLLIKGGKKEGFEWAVKELQPKKSSSGFSFGSLLSTSDEEKDLRGGIVGTLIRVGGDQSKKALQDAYKAYNGDDELMKATIAIGLLELGDAGPIETVRQALKHEDWDFTAVNAANALAKHKDYSGIPVLATLIEKKPEQKSGGNQMLDMFASSSGSDKKAEERRIVSLRRHVAISLGRIDHPDGVPILTGLLEDRYFNVRSSAAYAMADMTNPAVLSGIDKALQADYGVDRQKESRNPEIWTHLFRSFLAKFSKKDGSVAMVQTALKSSSPCVVFMAVMVK